MFEGIPLSLGDLSAYGLLVVLVAFLIVSLVRGWLVIRLHYCAMEDTMKYWRDAAKTAQETAAIQARTIEKQTVVGDTVVSVMSSLQRMQGQHPTSEDGGT